MEDIMAGGMRINDHKSWVGAAPNGEVFPNGTKTKTETSAGGAGELNDYWDTTEKIKEAQEMSQRKIKSNQPKQGYRN